MLTVNPFDLSAVHSSWHHCLKKAMNQMSDEYLNQLQTNTQWLPGHQQIFNAFSLPIDKVQYVLFGESPYPRAHSANGYAFWDADVTQLWSNTGLSKQVNRATSLRNIIKMLLIAENLLAANKTTQQDIATLDKQMLIKTNHELFSKLLSRGFLLLNATPVLRPKLVKKDAAAWKPFLKEVLAFLLTENSQVTFLLWGNIANDIDKLIPENHTSKLYAEHPYNLSFIQNPEIIHFFKPLHLLLDT